MTRKTKIIATIGPSCSKPSVLKKMIQKGFENLNRFDYETNLQKYYDHIKLCF